MFLGTCDSRGAGGVGVLVNTHLAMNIDSYESLTTRIGRLRLKRCGSVPALTVFVAYAPTSDYDEEEVEAFYVELEKLYKEDHTFYKVIVGDFNAKIGPRRSSEKLHIGTRGLEWNEQDVFFLPGNFGPGPIEAAEHEFEATTSTNAARKTPEHFLGENRNLVNLDNLLGASSSTSTSCANPFLLTSTAPASNPFASQQRKSPTLNEMRAAQSSSAPPIPQTGPLVGVLPQPHQSVQDSNPFANPF
ncbi:unnamed protein product [Heligmosomoides polygyrus]|uniref:Endonuclease/exonuclease/phosphatase domain-containing protein n=1 Tax=Heligmosomoides polygyrus TaxID=6339 RepID=A0A3P8CW78_HELPZ|nr:unnamed protein product [Heligmosomoides polygyrus]